MPLLTAKAWAMGLPPEAWQEVTWRQGTQGPLRSRFAAARVRPAQGYYNRKSAAVYRIPPEEWLIVEWPAREPEPTRYWLSTFPEATPITTLVYMAQLRWRIEEDYEDLKQEVGLADFEGRTWQGFHHHASLCIAARTFLMAERARLSPPTRGTACRLAQSAVSSPHPWRRPPSKGRAS
jgi:SRSO17 transposase